MEPGWGRRWRVRGWVRGAFNQTYSERQRPFRPSHPIDRGRAMGTISKRRRMAAVDISNALYLLLPLDRNTFIIKNSIYFTPETFVLRFPPTSPSHLFRQRFNFTRELMRVLWRKQLASPLLCKYARLILNKSD